MIILGSLGTAHTIKSIILRLTLPSYQTTIVLQFIQFLLQNISDKSQTLLCCV